VLFFNEWRAASKAASAAERVVSEAFMLYFNGKGRAPTPELIAQARQSRLVADDLFAVAMKQWDDTLKRTGPLED
jgi:hypothetical protein